MNCALFHDRLYALLDGALASLEEAEAHRSTCVRCDELYRLMQGTRRPDWWTLSRSGRRAD